MSAGKVSRCVHAVCSASCSFAPALFAAGTTCVLCCLVTAVSGCSCLHLLQLVAAADPRQRAFWQRSVTDPALAGDDADAAAMTALQAACRLWFTPRAMPLVSDTNEAVFELQASWCMRMMGQHLSECSCSLQTLLTACCPATTCLQLDKPTLAATVFARSKVVFWRGYWWCGDISSHAGLIRIYARAACSASMRPCSNAACNRVLYKTKASCLAMVVSMVCALLTT